MKEKRGVAEVATKTNADRSMGLNLTMRTPVWASYSPSAEKVEAARFRANETLSLFVPSLSSLHAIFKR